MQSDTDKILKIMHLKSN